MLKKLSKKYIQSSNLQPNRTDKGRIRAVQISSVNVIFLFYLCNMLVRCFDSFLLELFIVTILTIIII